MNPQRASERLASAGFHYPPAALQVTPHEARWLVRLPEQRLAWFADTDRGVSLMANDRRVLKLLEQRCSFTVPRVLYVSADGEFDVRSMVPGEAAPAAVFSRVREDAPYARELGTALGGMLAEQHSRIEIADVSGWLPQDISWPDSRDSIVRRLPRVTDDDDLIARADAVLEQYEGILVKNSDHVLAHADLGFHNLAFDADTHALNGIFDYETAAWADRHHDFRYLVFESERQDLLDAASIAYQAITGHAIQRERVFLYNAACAISYLAFRAGVNPDRLWCGRTLDEDLNWTRHAIARVLES